MFSFASVLAAGTLVMADQSAPTGTPPSWPYGLPPADAAPPPARGRAGGPRGGGPGRGQQQPQPTFTVPGSQFSFTRQQISNGYGPADWFPEDHPVMPEVVAHGKNPQQRACALCHLPTGQGRPENAPVQGLPYDYIIQQLTDFRNDLRHSAEPRKENTSEMISIAKSLSDEEMKEAATYFSSMKWRPYIRVVETDTIPRMRLQGNIFYRMDGDETEPLGNRIIESPEDTEQAQLRNPRSGYIAYVPPGSVKRGEAIARTGDNNRTTACTICHGTDLRGVGPIPPLAGRSPSYLARQLYDMKFGTRNGPMAALMKPVVAALTDEDIVNVVAYVTSLEP